MSDSMDMLHVLRESRELAARRRDATVRWMGTLALRAIVEGNDPREVARQCGFDPESDGRDDEDDMDSMMERMMGQMGLTLVSPGGRRTTGMDQFVRWLQDAVGDLVQDRIEQIDLGKKSPRE